MNYSSPMCSVLRLTFLVCLLIAGKANGQYSGAMTPFQGRFPTVEPSYSESSDVTNTPSAIAAYPNAYGNYTNPGAANLSTVSYSTPNPNTTAQQPSLSSVDMWYQLAELNSQMNAQQQELQYFRNELNLRNKRTMVYKLFANYEHVLVQPIQANNTGLIVETANGFSHVGFPWTIGYSPRVEFGLRGSQNIGFTTRYWHLDQNTSFTANAANGLLPVGRQGTVGYLSEDGDITTGIAFIESGTFFSRVRADVIDFELQKELSENVNFFAGLRYAKLVQLYRATTDQGNASSTAEFRGYGPTVALHLTHRFATPRVFVFGTVRQSLLFGHRDFRVSDSVNNITQTIGSLDVRNFEDGADALSHVSEIQVGTRLTPLEWLAVTVAIEGQLFTNVGGANPTAVFIGRDNGLAGDSPMDDSLGFIGLNVGTEIFW